MKLPPTLHYLRKIYHFLGGLSFALFLIGSTAIAVIAGTLLESTSTSHLYAASYTYSHPLFYLLLWGFFINILFSALRRWPFKVKHVPFLITHLGMLMILAGVMIKNGFGVQGNLALSEGSASNRLVQPESFSLGLENHAGDIIEYSLQKNGSLPQKTIADSNVQISGRIILPHATENRNTWFKKEHLTILGLPPIPLNNIEDKTTGPSAKIKFDQNLSPWHIYAYQGTNPEAILKFLYPKLVTLTITDKSTNLVTASYKLENQDAPLSSLNVDPLQITFQGEHTCQIPLSGPKALLNSNIKAPYLGGLPYAYDLSCDPTLIVVEDPDNTIHFIAITPYAEVVWKKEPRDEKRSLLVFGEGFGGYGVQTTLDVAIDPSQTSPSRAAREKAFIAFLTKKLQDAVAKHPTLAPPLELWKKAAAEKNVDLIASFVNFLIEWDNAGCWLFPKEAGISPETSDILLAIDWKHLPYATINGCRWNAQLFSELEVELQKGISPLTILHSKKWPLIEALEQESNEMDEGISKDHDLLTLLTRQVFSAAESIPTIEEQPVAVDSAPEQRASYLTAMFRAYGIHLTTLLHIPKDEEELKVLLTMQQEGEKENPSITLETNIHPSYQASVPTNKLEDLRPLFELKIRRDKEAQISYLLYDPHINNLKWPVLNGEYLAGFQSSSKEIPYRVRLRSARQINYPNSSQPYSFESDLIVTDLRDGSQVEKTISMNNVHETWDGYRFYLSSMSPSTEGELKRVQIVVNHDPAKYRLTYPGALMMSLGIILLFVMRPYKRSP